MRKYSKFRNPKARRLMSLILLLMPSTIPLVVQRVSLALQSVATYRVAFVPNLWWHKTRKYVADTPWADEPFSPANKLDKPAQEPSLACQSGPANSSEAHSARLWRLQIVPSFPDSLAVWVPCWRPASHGTNPLSHLRWTTVPCRLYHKWFPHIDGYFRNLGAFF